MRLCIIATSFLFWQIASAGLAEEVDGWDQIGLAEKFDAWDKEVIPALVNPDIAAKVDVYNAPEDWVSFKRLFCEEKEKLPEIPPLKILI